MSELKPRITESGAVEHVMQNSMLLCTHLHMAISRLHMVLILFLIICIMQILAKMRTVRSQLYLQQLTPVSQSMIQFMAN